MDAVLQQNWRFGLKTNGGPWFRHPPPPPPEDIFGFPPFDGLAATATARGNVPPTRTPGPGDEMPPEYWQAVLDKAVTERGNARPLDPDAGGCQRYSDTYCGSPAAVAAAPSKSRRPTPHDCTGKRPSGMTSVSDVGETL